MNQKLQVLQYMVHFEISVMKVTNGKYIESDDAGRNKRNEKKFWAIFFPRNKGKINDKSAFSTFKI